MNSSGKATMSAPRLAASSRARRTFSALALTSPTVGLSCASAIFRLSAGRAFIRMVEPAERVAEIGPARPGRSDLRSELALDVGQHAVALDVEVVEGIVRGEARAEADATVAREQAPVAGADADLDVAGHRVVDEQLGLDAVGVARIGDRKSTRLNSSHVSESRMPSS